MAEASADAPLTRRSELDNATNDTMNRAFTLIEENFVAVDAALRLSSSSRSSFLNLSSNFLSKFFLDQSESSTHGVINCIIQFTPACQRRIS